MEERAVRVGDVRKWREVPDGALVRPVGGGYIAVFDDERHLWADVAGDEVTVIALGLAGDESPADLQRLAETFEVREALVGLFKAEDPADDERLRAALMVLCDGADKRLRAAGWGPGMTAQDAARMLAEVKA